MLAIIGGSGLSTLSELKITHRQVFRTAYGEPSSPIVFGSLNNLPVAFLARHGFSHNFAPHEINYRANIDALFQAGVTEIISVSAVNVINEKFKVGDIILPNDLIDYTFARKHTYYEGANMNVCHINFSKPYDEVLRQRIIQKFQKADITVTDQATYSCLQGPRLPTKAEIKRYQLDGGDVYGMTAMPEAILAYEKNMAYAHICGVVDMTSDTALNRTCPIPYPDSAIEKIRQALSFI